MTDLSPPADQLLSEFHGWHLESLKAIRWPGMPVAQVSLLLLKFEESADIHWVDLDGAGIAHWNECTEQDVLESLDDDAIIEVVDLGEVWQAPIAAAVIASRPAMMPSWAQEIKISLQNGAHLRLAYLGDDCFTCGTALTFVTGRREDHRVAL